MRRNCRKNSSRSGSVPPANPATLRPPFANLFSKGHIKYGVTRSLRVKLRYRVMVNFTVKVRINITLFALYFIPRYLLDGATGGYCVHMVNSSF